MTTQTILRLFRTEFWDLGRTVCFVAIIEVRRHLFAREDIICDLEAEMARFCAKCATVPPTEKADAKPTTVLRAKATTQNRAIWRPKFCDRSGSRYRNHVKFGDLMADFRILIVFIGIMAMMDLECSASNSLTYIRNSVGPHKIRCNFVAPVSIDSSPQFGLRLCSRLKAPFVMLAERRRQDFSHLTIV